MSGAKRKTTSRSGPTFEEALEQVESIIDRIESGEIGLEESLERYREGVTLIKRCRSILDAAEQRVEELAKELDGADAAGEDA